MNDLNIFICGDVVNYTQYDGKVVDKDLEDVIKSTDYAVCNFEAPVISKGSPILKSGPHHSQRPETLKGLKEQGFDLLLLANNHIMDFGAQGLSETLDKAKACELDVLGAGLNFESAYRKKIVVIDGVRLGVINACEAQFGVLDYFRSNNEPGYAWINHHKIDQILAELKLECKYIIVFAHAGLENYSVPQKEWRIRYKALCDAGASIVVGSHPHVPQGFESYNGSKIFYSLGNFYFDSKNFINKNDSSYSVIFHLSKETKNIDFSLVYHCKSGGKTRLSKNHEKVDIEKLNLLLEKNNYEIAHDEMSLNAYKKIVSNFRLSTSKGWYTGDLIRSLKLIVGRVFLRRKRIDKEVLQLHLLRNEAYYYAARHSLELKYKGKYNE